MLQKKQIRNQNYEQKKCQSSTLILGKRANCNTVIIKHIPCKE